MDNSTKIALCATIIGAASLLVTAKRRWWVRPWIEKRNEKVNLPLLNVEFQECDDLGSFRNFLRMDKKTCDILLKIVNNKLSKQNTQFRESISAMDRLFTTLRFLATGESFQSLHYSFRIGQSTVSAIVIETCKFIYECLKNDYLKIPSHAEDWLNISEMFNIKWNLLNVVGALDGKHICFCPPRSEGSLYFNYKHQHSIVLLALVDADYKFLYVDIGTNGRISDGGVYNKSSLKKAIEQNYLNIPDERPLPGRVKNIPFVIVADGAFPLTYNILKPFPFRGLNHEQKIFNYRLSRCRRAVENAFGILANKWRCLLTTLHLTYEKVQLITLTCCVLHNFLRVHCPLQSEFREDAGVDRRYTFKYGLNQQVGNRPRNIALNVRNEFKEYINNEGALPWQDLGAQRKCDILNVY